MIRQNNRNKLSKIPAILATVPLVLLLWAPAYAQGTQQTAPRQPAGTASSSGQSKGGFTISPAMADGQLTHGYNFAIAAGEQINNFAYIKNMSNSPVHFSLYGADPTVSNTGSPAYETRDQSIDGEGTWVKFDEPEIELASGEEKTVRFSVSVPPGTPLGDYRAGVTMEKGKQASNVPGISIATRMISQAKIKVIEGTNAGTTPSSSDTGMKLVGIAPTAATPVWKTYYFWISMSLFIISLGLLVWALFHEKKAKSTERKAATHHTGAHPVDAKRLSLPTKTKHVAKSSIKHKPGKRTTK